MSVENVAQQILENCIYALGMGSVPIKKETLPMGACRLASAGCTFLSISTVGFAAGNRESSAR